MAVRLSEIANALGAPVLGCDLVLDRPAEPGAAGPRDLALAMSARYAEALAASRAQAALVWPGCDWQALGLVGAVAVPRAKMAMAAVTAAFDSRTRQDGIHATAQIAADAQVGADVSIGAFTVIGPGAVIGPGTGLADHVSVGAGVAVGANCDLHPGVRLYPGVRLGARVIVHANAVIGADGFSYATTGPANEERALRTAGREALTPPADATRHKVHSLGGAVIGDDVEIGAGSTVDAGTIRATQIGAGCKLDNLCQVGHNAVLGADCVLSAQAAVAGSAVLGDRVVMGGKSGIRDNITVGADVVLGGGAIVLDPLPPGQFVLGYPAQPVPVFRAGLRALRRLTVPKKGPND